MRLSTYTFVAVFGLGSAAFAQPTAPAAPKARIVSVIGNSYLGVNVQEIDSERAKALKLREEAGVEVTRVSPDSPAEKGGLKSGDAILQYNGQRVEGMEQFQRLIHETPPGREVKLEVFRNGAPQTVNLKVGERRTSGVAFAAPAMAPRNFEFRMPDMPRSFMSWQSSILGVEAESLDGQLAQYFGVKEGVLIRSVTSGSAAEKGGIKAGDVIVRVDDSKVSTPADVSSRLRSMRGKQVNIVVMREHKEIPVTVTIDEERRAGWFQQRDWDSSLQNFFAAPRKVRSINLQQN
jgi:serine protease Do